MALGEMLEGRGLVRTGAKWSGTAARPGRVERGRRDDTEFDAVTDALLTRLGEGGSNRLSSAVTHKRPARDKLALSPGWLCIGPDARWNGMTVLRDIH